MALADPEMFGPATLVATQSLTLFQGLLPKLTEIRQADPHNDPEYAADVHLAELAACGMNVGIALICCTFTHSYTPLIVAVVMCAFLVSIYESALNGRPFSRQAWANAAEVS